jgi:hypothetical protein
MEPSSQSGPQREQSAPQLQPLPATPQPKAEGARVNISPSQAPDARPRSTARRAILFGALFIGAIAIGAFGSGLVKMPGTNQLSVPVAATTQTQSGPIDEQDKVRGIGVRIQNLTPDLAKSLGSSRIEGVAVLTVFPKSPANGAGIRADDIIIAADGVPLRQVGELASKIQLTTVGQQIALTFERNGTAQTAMVRVELRNRCQTPGSPVCSW